VHARGALAPRARSKKARTLSLFLSFVHTHFFLVFARKLGPQTRPGMRPSAARIARAEAYMSRVYGPPTDALPLTRPVRGSCVTPADLQTAWTPRPLPEDHAHRGRYLWTDAFAVLNYVSLALLAPPDEVGLGGRRTQKKKKKKLSRHTCTRASSSHLKM